MLTQIHLAGGLQLTFVSHRSSNLRIVSARTRTTTKGSLLLARFTNSARIIKHTAKLTPSQKKFLVRLLSGASAAQIGKKSRLSVHTVNNHTRAIFDAFGMKSRPQLMALFITIPEDLAYEVASL